MRPATRLFCLAVFGADELNRDVRVLEESAITDEFFAAVVIALLLRGYL
jgi:hypothetical protein